MLIAEYGVSAVGCRSNLLVMETMCSAMGRGVRGLRTGPASCLFMASPPPRTSGTPLLRWGLCPSLFTLSHRPFVCLCSECHTAHLFVFVHNVTLPICVSVFTMSHCPFVCLCSQCHTAHLCVCVHNATCSAHLFFFVNNSTVPICLSLYTMLQCPFVCLCSQCCMECPLVCLCSQCSYAHFFVFVHNVTQPKHQAL